jgi:lipopolysaccharide transport system ATP-binding protein
MSETVIRVEGLGKRYRIDEGVRDTALSHLIGHALRTPMRLLTGGSDGPNNRPNGGAERRGATSEASIGASWRGSGIIWALKEVSFEGRQGEVVELIGRNGAGKCRFMVVTRARVPVEVTRPNGDRTFKNYNSWIDQPAWLLRANIVWSLVGNIVTA